MCNIVRRDMSAYMVHRYERLSSRVRNALCEGYTGEQRSDKPGRIGDRHGVDTVNISSRLFESFFNHAAYSLAVCA